MPYAFGALALVLIGTVLVGGYIEENRIFKLTSPCEPKKGCCPH
jgi:hypothetical protein